MERRATRENSKHIILPGLTAPAGVHTAPLAEVDNPDDVNQHVEQAYVEVGAASYTCGSLLDAAAGYEGSPAAAGAWLPPTALMRCCAAARLQQQVQQWCCPAEGSCLQQTHPGLTSHTPATLAAGSLPHGRCLGRPPRIQQQCISPALIQHPKQQLSLHAPLCLELTMAPVLDPPCLPPAVPAALRLLPFPLHPPRLRTSASRAATAACCMTCSTSAAC
jgi:hypothetical protein